MIPTSPPITGRVHHSRPYLDTFEVIKTRSGYARIRCNLCGERLRVYRTNVSPKREFVLHLFRDHPEYDKYDEGMVFTDSKVEYVRVYDRWGNKCLIIIDCRPAVVARDEVFVPSDDVFNDYDYQLLLNSVHEAERALYRARRRLREHLNELKEASTHLYVAEILADKL